MIQKTLTLGSLFDGSGGFPLGGILAGIEPVWSAEIEPFPVLVTHKRLPKVKHYGDTLFIGLVLDLWIEKGNNDVEYDVPATQEDFDAFSR